MTVQSIFLLRHAETPWNAEGRLQGHADIALSARGLRSVVGMRLPNMCRGARWFSSPLQRARATAHALGAGALEIVPALIEMDWGEWEGQRLVDLRARFGESMRDNEAAGLDFRPPAGESPRDVAARAVGWCRSVGGQTEVAPGDTPRVQAARAAEITAPAVRKSGMTAAWPAGSRQPPGAPDAKPRPSGDPIGRHRLRPPLVAVTHKGVIRAVLAHAWAWNMRGKPPVRLRWNCVHEVRVDAACRLSVGRLNVPLDERGGPATGTEV